MTLGAGESFAGYTIVKQLGSGGMGEVYLAEHPRLPRRDALKVMRSEISADITFRARFIREAESIAALQHPHIVTVYDRGEEDGQVWIATQYIDGFDASELLLGHRYPNGIPVDEALEIATAIADALDHAHGHGLIHRDVKPANILLSRPDRDGIRRTYLADFGIARPLEETAGLTSTNFVLGTFAYAAPEQLMGSALDGRADQYALAAAVYHLLTGTTVFPDSNQVAVISRKLTRPAPAPSAIRPELAPLDRAFARALAKNPEHRFQRCRDFAAAIASDAARGSIGYPSTAATQHAAALNPKRTNNFGMTAHGHPEYPSRLARTGHSQIEDSTRLVDTYAVGRNLTAARARLEKAAKDGDIGAMNSLGVLLDSSLDPPDLPAARFWYEKAASAGHTPAMFNLGVLLLFKWNPLDLDGARTWWERAAKNGHADAMNYLGELAHASNDLTAARSWWEKSAEIGQLDAMNALGVLLECEWDPPDPSAAQAWYEKAAEAGHLEAMNNLGLLLESPDVDAAIMWWERAAHGGHLDAVANLARLHFFLQDLPQSRFWGERAAAAGHLDSMMTLGILLESYWDPPDLDAASAWYEKAAQSVRNNWSEVREAVRRQSRVVDVMLADAKVRRVQDSNLILTHPAAPVAKRLNASESNDVIHAALKEVLEVDWRVRCEAGDLLEKQSALLTPGQ